MIKFKKILYPNTKKNHYYGWFDVLELVKSELEDVNSNIILDAWVDNVFWKNSNKKDYKYDWMGVIHSVNCDNENLHNNTIKNLIVHPFFLRNINKCKGLITLCNHTKEIIQNHVKIPVYSTHLPKPSGVFKFKFNIEEYLLKPTIYQSGFHGRNFKRFANFSTSSIKRMNVYNHWNETYVQIELENLANNILIEKKFLTNDDYILNLTNSIGFSYYYDIAASNALLDHIITNTPIIVNKLPAVVEYIGEKYPMFYENIENNPDSYILDRSFLEDTHLYLKERSKLNIFTVDKFKEDLLSFVENSTKSI